MNQAVAFDNHAHAAEEGLGPRPFGVKPVKFAMWLFLASEIMFFTGLLGSFVILRFSDPDGFHLAAQKLNWMLAAANTVLLITSSLTMALAVAAAQKNEAPRTGRFLLFTFVFGIAFLGLKAIEYTGKIQHDILPGTHIFFGFYYTMTGCHALHLIAGLIPIFIKWLNAVRGRVNGEGMELLGLYWHFVDLVWIFLFPLLYLL